MMRKILSIIPVILLFLGLHTAATAGSPWGTDFEAARARALAEGKDLILNVSTSAAGSVRIEIQDQAGDPIEGFSMDDAPEIFGDSLELVAPWKDGRDLAELAGLPIRLRIALRDADLYAFRFGS